ncbi:hypothetical protein A4X06_0g5906 [Tilletia controversa]|uniref:Uncharacterized protein n=3 Tax=Tilletia TaxID=13289 RepID=A0A8X7SVU0_9BASI|nr:hypothetical protein CF336_g5474 [Tilletia laevis]KAE8196962.1 hypothetical protein CF335_g4727 [Tilletia laevis]KAE8244911.1 hypothetical protein A4X06_0g5906 [Tilletia controversa]KAE8257189.1 hypothetical protein A4X03_0g4750 [Tilletia caries]
MREREPTSGSCASTSTTLSCASTSASTSASIPAERSRRSSLKTADETTGLLSSVSHQDRYGHGQDDTDASLRGSSPPIPQFSRTAIIISVGAFLHMMGICANYTYALISTRAFICAAYYESNPHDPGLLSHKPCRTPIVEVALANYIRNLCLITGIINPFAILFWGRFLRRIGPKGLAMIANLSVILFDPIPWILLPLGPPVGTPHPYISANMCKHILLLSATIGAATGMGTLHTLAFRTMLVNVASPNQVTIHLSLFALAAYASTALGPLAQAQQDINHAADWRLARILTASVLIAAAAMANAPLMEFLTYRYGLDGTDLSFLLSSQAAVSGLLVFLGVPALRAAVERRSQKPASLANVDLTDFEEVEEVDEGEGEMVVNMSSCSAGTGPSLDDHPPGVDIERGQGRGRRAAKLRRKRSQVSYHSTTASSRTIPTTNRTQQHRQLRAAFWDWQARIELNSSTTALMAILLPWSLILLGVAFPYQTLSPVVLVLGWIFGSPDGTISSFLQSAGLAVLKSASVDTAVVDDFMTSFNTLSTLVTLASSGFVTVYSHSVQTLPWLTFVFPTTLALLSLAILRPLLLPLRRHRPSGARRGVGNL